jgi:hypothetical protein
MLRGGGVGGCSEGAIRRAADSCNTRLARRVRALGFGVSVHPPGRHGVIKGDLSWLMQSASRCWARGSIS